MADASPAAVKGDYLKKAEQLFTEAVESSVRTATFKLKESNDSLKAQVQSLRATLEGRSTLFDGQVARARTAEARVVELEKKDREQFVTISALQARLVELESTKKS